MQLLFEKYVLRMKWTISMHDVLLLSSPQIPRVIAASDEEAAFVFISELGCFFAVVATKEIGVISRYESEALRVHGHVMLFRSFFFSCILFLLPFLYFSFCH